MVHVLNPKPFVWHCVEEKVRVRLKWGIEYIGVLASADDYFNLHLADAVEVADEGRAEKVPVGDVVIRCNNVLYLGKA